jgi:zinc D-Ala-D-Ala carboxypeptidase
MNLTPNFTLAELTVTDHREFKNESNPTETENLKRLANLLEQVKVAIGGKPVMVNSAFRCKEVNDAVGSKDTSQHRIGCAADIRVPGMVPNAVVKAIIAAKLPFDQLIREFDRWTHISIPNDPKGKPRGQVLIIDSKGTRPY